MVRQVGERAKVTPVQRKVEPRRTARRYSSVTGQTTLRPPERAVRSKPVAEVARRPLQLRVDVPVLLIVITLLIFGLVMVYSASYYYSLGHYGKSSTMFYRQLLWVVLGVAGAIFLWRLDYHYLRLVAVPAILVTLGLLVAVLVQSNVFNGAARTLFGGSVQPSELAKLVIIIYLSIWLHSKQEKLSDVTFGLIPLAGILGVTCSLIVLEPDLSAVATIIALGGLMFFLADADLRQIGILFVLAVIVGYVLVHFYATGQDRMETYLAGLQDPIQANDHVRWAYEAFIRGGWLGVGIGNAKTKLTGLPVPPTDSIFAVIGEETGILGTLSLLALYTGLLWRGTRIALGAPDQFGRLLAAGVTIWIAFEAFVNMAVILNILPFAGNALPFISAGGSSMVISLAAIGILLSVARQSVKKSEEESVFYNAVISLRRWDRRRRVSRPGRPADSSE